MADSKRDPSGVHGTARSYRVSPLMELAASLPSVDRALDDFIARATQSDPDSVPAALDAYDAPEATFVEHHRHDRTDHGAPLVHDAEDQVQVLAELRDRLEAAERRAYAAEQRSQALSQALALRTVPGESRDRRGAAPPRNHAAVADRRAPSSSAGSADATSDSLAAGEAMRPAPIADRNAIRAPGSQRMRGLAVACSFLAGIAATFAMSELVWNEAGGPAVSRPAGTAAPGGPAQLSPRPMVTPIPPPIVTPIEPPPPAAHAATGTPRPTPVTVPETSVTVAPKAAGDPRSATVTAGAASHPASSAPAPSAASNSRPAAPAQATDPVAAPHDDDAVDPATSDRTEPAKPDEPAVPHDGQPADSPSGPS